MRAANHGRPALPRLGSEPLLRRGRWSWRAGGMGLRRRLIFPALILAALLWVAGCGGGSGGNPLVSITVAPADAELAIGEPRQFTAMGLSRNGNEADLTGEVAWLSSDAAVAAVDSGGLVTALVEGQAVITAGLGGISGTATLTAAAITVDSITSVTVSPGTALIFVGEYRQFLAIGTDGGGNEIDLTDSVLWSSSDTAIATLDAAGLASGLTEGEVTVSADSGTYSASASLIVSTPVVQLTALSITPSSAAIAPGEMLQFAAIGAFDDDSTLDLTADTLWSSGNGSVVAIDASGLAIGLAEGSATIGADSGGLYATTLLTVTGSAENPLVSIALTPADATIMMGETLQYGATGHLLDGATVVVTDLAGWSTSGGGVASVTAGGMATGMLPGTVTLAATLAGITGETGLTVETNPAIPPVSVTISPSGTALLIGEVVQLTANGLYQNGSSLEVTGTAAWSSNDVSVATVDAGGLANGLATGTATISAGWEGLEGTMELVVTSPPSPPVSFANVGVITPSPVAVTANGSVDLLVEIPESAESIGIIVLGSDGNYKFVDHGLMTVIPTDYILAPDGSQVPLSFNMIDYDGDGIEEPTGDNLTNRQAAALFFPNDGSAAILAPGTYTFPIGAINESWTDFGADTLQPYVFYKSSSAGPQTMTINLWVAEGVAPAIDSPAAAQADPEILGAIAVLENVYQTQAGLTLVINLNTVPASYVSIETEAEQDTLLRTYPLSAPSNALNLFIVGELTYIDGGAPVGVIGLSAGIPGPFNLHGTVVSGTLAEYQGDGVGNLLGFTLAHEFGHFLGLWHTSQTDDEQINIIGHDPIADTQECTTADLSPPFYVDNCPDRNNMMFPIAVDEPDPPVSASQIKVIQLNPAIGTPLNP